MSEELKPCPFCGSAVKMARHKGSDETGERWDYFAVECRGKDHNVICDAGDTAAEVAAAWNRRASPIPTPEGQGGGEREEAIALAARIVEEYTMYDFGMSPANELKLARALLSSPRVEEVRREALEEAAEVVRSFSLRGPTGSLHLTAKIVDTERAIRALSLQVG